MNVVGHREAVGEGVPAAGTGVVAKDFEAQAGQLLAGELDGFSGVEQIGEALAIAVGFAHPDERSPPAFPDTVGFGVEARLHERFSAEGRSRTKSK